MVQGEFFCTVGEAVGWSIMDVAVNVPHTRIVKWLIGELDCVEVIKYDSCSAVFVGGEVLCKFWSMGITFSDLYRVRYEALMGVPHNVVLGI